MNYQELIERLRKGFGTAAGRATQVSFYHMWCQKAAEAIESLLNALDVAEGEVKRTVAERDAALAELAKYRDAPVVAWCHYDYAEKTADYLQHFKDTYASIPLIVKPGENQ